MALPQVIGNRAGRRDKRQQFERIPKNAEFDAKENPRIIIISKQKCVEN